MSKAVSRKQRDAQKRNRTIAKSVLIALAVIIVAGGGFFCADKYASNQYMDGESHGIAKMRAVDRKHPFVKYHKKVVHKRVPVVHIKDASNAQIEHAVKETHQQDLSDVQNIANKNQRNANNGQSKNGSKTSVKVIKAKGHQSSDSTPSQSSTNSSSDSDLENHGGGASIGQALKAEAKADHADVNAKY